MIWLAALMLLLGALLLVINHLLVERRRVRQINQRLQGQTLRENRFGSWLRAVGSSRFGQRSVRIDSETQTLLNRLGWRRASERSLYAACQIGTPLLTFGLAIFLQQVFFPQADNRWIIPMLATGGGYLLPKRVLAYASARRQRTLAVEISTFIPLLRILFESGMAVEQALRVLSSEAQKLLPELTGELRLILARVDSGLELGQELHKAAVMLAVDEFSDTCVILEQLIHQGGGAMKSLLALKQLLDDRRLTRLQEYISKMSAKMSVVMMLFLFPALLIVLAGPGFTAIARAFAN
ncbi:type II secretion system F family protein [Pseudomonas granadensis]|uniref:Type II secretion system F family protein n=1 Tax=Pseudomonas granadensis TaxID=1421430 RepID=A0ABX7GHX9_9PSED|nr:type II secretion system F family protein [Pseudomonas granadensis]MBN6775888.1 type II secretion system F family protein [Pseudomonas granadensis]MBN6804064.1 type II secretion system F family protein [Pseudomonas granadensis]MBN6830743.1 type II secretion system F family protein [Pseudomonas granadensis]MBN6838285.1 type II secretion system F family protein [Pseudomonas granadensis]MBN6867647.1 type II secretion system F family protein [Pseudomonas granadensis]